MPWTSAAGSRVRCGTNPRSGSRHSSKPCETPTVHRNRAIECEPAQVHPPSPGTPGESRGEGFSAVALAEDPHPNPLPEYRARGPDSLGRETSGSKLGIKGQPCLRTAPL